MRIIIKDTIQSIKSEVATVAIKRSNLEKDTARLMQEIGGLAYRTDSLKSLAQKAFVVQSKLHTDLAKLEKEKKFVIYEEYLTLLNQYPNPDFDFIQKLISKIKNDRDEVADKIVAILTGKLQAPRYKVISAYILYHSLFRREYLDIIQQEIGITIQQSKDKGQNATYEISGDNPTNTLLAVLKSPLWDKDQKREFAYTIVNQLENISCLDPITNSLIFIPAFYSIQEKGNKWNDIDFWLKYTSLNLKNLLDKSKRPLIKDTAAAFINEYKQENSKYISKKVNILDNLTQLAAI